MCSCGEVATNLVTVQVNNFRGDDDVYYACETHKRDITFLTRPQE